MNHIYRLVWCKSLNAMVVASELSSRQHGGVSASPRSGKGMKLLSIALLGMGGFIYATGAFAQSTGNVKLDDLQSLVSKYDAPLVGATSAGTVQAVAGAPVTVVKQVVSGLPVGGTLAQVGQAVKSTLASVPPIHAGVHASTPVAHVHAGARIDHHGVAVGAGVRTTSLASAVSSVTNQTAGLPVAGKVLSTVGGVVNTVAAAIPPLHVGVGVRVGAPSTMEPLVADRQRYDSQVSSQARALGIADGNGGGGLPTQVIGSVIDNVAKVPVAGPVVAQVGSVLTSVTSGAGNPTGALGNVVGTVTGVTSQIPVVGPVVGQVAGALGSVTSGTGNPTGALGNVVSTVTGVTSQIPVVGPVVGQVAGALGSVTSGAGNPTGALGNVVSTVTGVTSQIPVVGPVVGQVAGALGSVTSGTGNPTGALGNVVSTVTGVTSQIPVVGPVVGQVAGALGSVTSGAGNPTGALGNVVGTVTGVTSQIPVVGPVVGQVAGALGSVTSGAGNPTGALGNVVSTVTGVTSQIPVVGPVVGQVAGALGSVTSGAGNPTGALGNVVSTVTGVTSQIPVVGPVVGQVAGTLGSVTSGKNDLGTTLGTVVGGVVNNGAKLPVLGDTVASVGQALKTVTSGGALGSGLQGQLGQVVGGLVNSLAQQPGVGPVVAKVGETLQETTAQIGNDNGGGAGVGDLTGVIGKVLGGVEGVTSKVPVVGPVVGQVAGALGSATSGGGDLTGTLGNVVGTVAGATSKVPVVGPVVGQVAGALGSVTSGGGDLTSTLGNVVGTVTATTSQVPVVGPVVAQVGDALASVTSGDGVTGTLGNVVGTVTGATSQIPVVGSVVSQLGGALTSVTSDSGGLSQVTGLLPLTSSSAAASSDAMVASSNTAMASATPMAAPVVPPPSATPTGLIIGNGGVVGTATQLLGSTESSLFNADGSERPITNGSLTVSSANFSQGYSTLNLLGLPVVNSTPVGTVLTTVDGTVLGGTGTNSHLTLIGGVNSGNYISNINNGAAGGLLGLVLPKNAPAWASTCLNVLGVLKESCWAVNAAQDNQVLVGDGASANGSEEVVIGTNAKHTLPTVDASQAFPGNGTNDPNNPTGVPTADYAARLGHSVVIGDGASGTANAQTILGAGATASVANSVALGFDSDASRGGQTNYAAYGLAAPQTSVGEVSIGSPGAERQITNVAAGSADTDAVNVAQLKGVASTADNSVQYDSISHTLVTLAGPASTDGGVTGGTTITNLHQGALSATSTDAVNGSQLFATNSSLVKYMGGTTSFDPTTNTWTAPSFSVVSIDSKGGSTTGSYDNVTDAFNAVDGSLTSLNSRIKNINTTGITYFHANSTLADSSATGTDSVAVGPEAVAGGDASMAMGKGASTSAANALALGAGATASMANSIALGAGSSTVIGAQSGYTAYGLSAPQTSAGEVNVGNRQITGVAAGAADDDAVNVAQLKSVAATADNSVQYDDASHTAVTLAGPASTDGGLTGGTLFTNLHQGAESATSTDAVNGSQLWHWTQDDTNIYSNLSLYKDIQNIHPGTGSVKYFNVNSTGPDSSATGSDSVAIGPSAKSGGKDSVAMGNGADASADNSVAIGAGSVADRANTVSVGSAGNERQVTNVAAGTATTDAVNVGQLDSAISTTTKGTVRYDTNTDGSIDYGSVTLGNGGTGDTTVHNVAAGTAPTDAANVGQVQQAMDWSKTYTDQRFDQINGQIQKVGHRADAGVAAAMATAGLPQAYEPGRSMAAISAGSFRGESSLAIGISTISEGGRWVYKVAGSADTRGDAGVSVGAGMQW